jgi:hypothetical protein
MDVRSPQPANRDAGGRVLVAGLGCLIVMVLAGGALVAHAVQVTGVVVLPRHVSLDARPTDLRPARALARTVADDGSCGSFEDLAFDGIGSWTFTCQRGSSGEIWYEVTVFGTDQARAEFLKRVTSQHEDVVLGRAYAVHRSGADSTDDAAFPGVVLPPHPGR